MPLLLAVATGCAFALIGVAVLEHFFTIPVTGQVALGGLFGSASGIFCYKEYVATMR